MGNEQIDNDLDGKKPIDIGKTSGEGTINHFDDHFGTSNSSEPLELRVQQCLSAIRRYLDVSSSYYNKGQDEYYARIALIEAVQAHEEKNYAIGAVAVYVDNGVVYEYRGRNTMGTDRNLTGHAEANALMIFQEDFRKPVEERQPFTKYPLSECDACTNLPTGLSLFGTLEPCLMCSVLLTHARAKRSISTVIDGNIIQHNGFTISDGAAMCIGDKANMQPLLWQRIQKQIGLEFKLLHTTDETLRKLSKEIFELSLEEVVRKRYEKP